MAARQILSQLDFCQDIKQREKNFWTKTSAEFGQKQKWRSCTGVLDPNDKMFKHVKLWAGVGLLKKSSFWNCRLGWRRLKDKNHFTIWNCRKGGMEPFEIQTGSELCCSVRSSPHPPTPTDKLLDGCISVSNLLQYFQPWENINPFQVGTLWLLSQFTTMKNWNSDIRRISGSCHLDHTMATMRSSSARKEIAKRPSSDVQVVRKGYRDL